MDAKPNPVGSEEIARLTALCEILRKAALWIDDEDTVESARGAIQQAAIAISALLSSLTTAREEIERLTKLLEERSASEDWDSPCPARPEAPPLAAVPEQNARTMRHIAISARSPAGLFFATSPDDRGFMASGTTLSALLRDAANAVEELAAARADNSAPAANAGGAGRAENGPLPVSEADRETTSLRVERDALREALTPFVKAFEIRSERYEKRGSAAEKWHAEMPGHWPIDLTVTMDDGRKGKALLSHPDEKTTT